jgi:hypothetical protein
LTRLRDAEQRYAFVGSILARLTTMIDDPEARGTLKLGALMREFRAMATLQLAIGQMLDRFEKGLPREEPPNVFDQFENQFPSTAAVNETAIEGTR